MEDLYYYNNGQKFLKEDFGCEEDWLDFQYYMNREDAVLFEMANLRGNDIKLHERIPFSLFICNKDAVHGIHAIRVKVLWNPNKMTNSPDGYIELHGNYLYQSYSKKYKPTEKEVTILRDFCKRYKVLLAAVWEKVLDPNDFIDYVRGLSSWQQLVNSFENINEDKLDLISHCQGLKDLEYAIRRNKMFNLND